MGRETETFCVRRVRLSCAYRSTFPAVRGEWKGINTVTQSRDKLLIFNMAVVVFAGTAIVPYHYQF